jgi:hypothetical protein
MVTAEVSEDNDESDTKRQEHKAPERESRSSEQRIFLLTVPYYLELSQVESHRLHAHT